jgi:CRISPR-associated exonuclease Cas4
MNDDDLIPLRYLNDFLFCERRAAMHLIEGIWLDNQFTTEGSYAHRNVDLENNLKRGNKRNVTAMWVVSYRLGLIGKTDLVEFRNEVPYPVDFKRGKRKRWDNNEVQLCAQAMCLEEMLEISIPRGAIFHIKSQHRQEIEFDPLLRDKTEQTAIQLRNLIKSMQTPAAKYKPRCRGCSLFEWCMPKAAKPRATAQRYLLSLIEDCETETPS